MAFSFAFGLAALIVFRSVELEKSGETKPERFFQSVYFQKVKAITLFFDEWTSIRFILEIVPRWKESKIGRKYTYISVVNLLLTLVIFQIF